MSLNGLFFGFPARSHTVPSLSVVQELLGRGARIRYYSTSKFRPLIEATGAEYIAYPAAFESLGDQIDLAGHIERVVKVTTQFLPKLLGEVAERPSFVLFDSQALWGRLAARELGVVSAASTTTFAFTRSMLQLISHGRGGGLEGPRVMEQLAKLDRSDIRDYADVVVPTGDLKLVYTSRFFQPGGRFFDSSHLFVGPLLAARPRAGASIAVSGARPLAYVSFGTILDDNLGLLRRIGGILSDAGWQVVVSLGDHDRTASGDWPPHVQVYPFVDQMAVLARADLAVTHGGMASVSEILAHGVPSIVVPHGMDQHLVGRRAAALGAAIVIDDPSSADQWNSALSHISAGRAGLVAAAARVGDSFADVVPVASAVQEFLDRVKAGR